MHKVLFHFKAPDVVTTLFGVTQIVMYSYAVCVVLGTLLACLLIHYDAKKSLPKWRISPAFYYSMFAAGYIGGKLFFYLEKPMYYIEKPTRILNSFSGGLVCYGSVIAVILFAIIYARLKKLPILCLLDVLSIASTIPIAFGRLGCFLNGCCYGTPTDHSIGMVFPTTAPIAVHPTQLYEAAWMCILFLVLSVARKYKKWNGQIFILNLTLYAIGRACIETLRGDDRGFIVQGWLSHAQTIAIAAVLISIILFIRQHKKFINSSLN